MTKQEIEQTIIKRDGFTFFPRTEFVEINLEDGTKVFDYTVTATAEDVYGEWLANKDKPPEPTKTEKLQQRIAELESVIDAMLTGGTL